MGWELLKILLVTGLSGLFDILIRIAKMFFLYCYLKKISGSPAVQVF